MTRRKLSKFAGLNAIGPAATSPTGMQVLQRVIGETLIATSHPEGTLAGMNKRVLEINRARRWKALAKKLYRERKAT